MAINYKQCVRCGSKNVFSIIYGLPSEEGYLLAGTRRITFGGCCVTPESPDYQCQECDQEWTRMEAVNVAYRKIKILKASVGGFGGPHYDAEINLINHTVSWHGRENDHEETPVETVEHKIRKYNRETLLEMLKTLDILIWKSKYVAHGVCDGTQWGLEIVRDGRTIQKYGSNAYPENWNHFCKLIRRMTRRRFA